MASPEKLQLFGRYTRRILIAAAYLLPIALFVRAVTFWGRGIIDSEAMEFVLNYLQKRPFFAQIFDPQINDWGAYQARELSYVFDWIDARVFAALLDHHVLLFVPLSGILGLIVVCAVYFWGARKVFGLNGVMASMLLSLFLSCIVVQASTPILYRSSKIILCIALLAFLFYTFSLLKGEKRSVIAAKGAALFFLGLVMALCDRQGFYYLISTTLVVSLLWFIAKTREESAERGYLRVIFVNVATIIATVFYNRIFAPQLIHALNGYWPNFFYQNLPWSQLLDPALPAKAWQLFQQQVSFFFGSVPFLALASAIVIAAVGVAWKCRNAINRHHLTLLAVSVVSIIAIFGLLATMIARHPALYSIRDHSFWYYTLTIHVVILFGVTAWISFLSPGDRSRFNPLLYALIAVLIASNILAYGRHRQTMIAANGWFEGQYQHSRALTEQFATAPPQREELQSRSSDLFLDDQAHFLENVELSYLHLTGATQSHPPGRP